MTPGFFPYKKISQVPLEQIQQRLISLFTRRGMPQWFKVDNGLPFGDPNRETTPVIALWLISLGVGVIWNRPRHPQDNAKVERNQAILKNWAEPHLCQNTIELQQRVNYAIDFHNSRYPVRRLGKKTRSEAFPELEKHTGRVFDPLKAQLEPVLQFLAKGHWIRSASKTGQIYIFNHRFYIGAQYRYQQVSVKLDPSNNQWIVLDKQGLLIQTVASKITLENISKLDLSPKT